MAHCIFCKILEGDISAEKIFENSDALAFLDLHPCAVGHTLVIPKIHAATLTDLPEAVASALLPAVKEVVEKLTKAIQPEGFTIGINNGQAAGQAISHLHFHIIPRFAGDGGGNLHTVVQNEVGEPLAETAKRIRAVN